jgi:hypothetical protein
MNSFDPRVELAKLQPASESGRGMAVAVGNAWVRFLRNYGPIPNNDNMYDEHIRRKIKRHKIKPIELPAPFLKELLENFARALPDSYFLTGTAGDGKTYHCREVFAALGGSEEDWNGGAHVQRLKLRDLEIVFVKDLSELSADDSEALLAELVKDVADPAAKRAYLVAANHGQLLEKLKTADPESDRARFARAVEDLMVTRKTSETGFRLQLRDLSRSPVTDLIGQVITAITDHEGWAGCSGCEHAQSNQCPITENRRRLIGAGDGGLFRDRLTALVEISEHNGHHFPMRQLLVLVTNILLGHPKARDGLMACSDVIALLEKGEVDQASIYRNAFGENLKAGRAERTEPFDKLSLFGIGSETNNVVDNVLVYGALDPALTEPYHTLMGADPIYGATKAYANAQADYLEGRDPKAEDRFLALLRAQRQRLFFTMPAKLVADHSVWDLTVFKFAGEYLDIVRAVKKQATMPRESLASMVRGLNRVFSGMLVQNSDELILASSGSHSQTRTSPLVDAMISVRRNVGQEVALVESDPGPFDIRVSFTRDNDPAPVALKITPTRFEFLRRVSEGALPSSFSLECHEDFLAFKARLLSAVIRLRELDGEGDDSSELTLNFLDLSSDGRASPRRVSIRS